MGINIGNYNFEGPFTTTANLKNQSGVYAILGRNFTSERWKVVDIGESAAVRDRVDNHDRATCWKRRGHSQLTAAVYYCAQQPRMRIEQELRNQFNPPCGDR
ncbi:MAG: hypothetical protein Kow0060_21090 [Methylohalobius crimeensis]